MGVSVFLDPSGFTAKSHRSGESGSNGLTLDSQGQLVLCQHGDRRVARMKASTQNPKSEFVTLAANYQGEKTKTPPGPVAQTFPLTSTFIPSFPPKRSGCFFRYCEESKKTFPFLINPFFLSS